jgi:hypothetical protein
MSDKNDSQRWGRRSGAELRRLQAQVALLRRITGVFSETLEYGLRVLDLASRLHSGTLGKIRSNQSFNQSRDRKFRSSAASVRAP